MSRRAPALLQTIAHNVRVLRTKAGLSQEQLAELSGLHRTYVGGIERGERNVTVLSLQKIATALKVTPANLLADGRDRRV